MPKRVLLIAHAFPPCHAVAALRAAKFAKYLPDFGWEPIVVTRNWHDEHGGGEEPRDTRVVRTEYQDRLALFRRGPTRRTSGAIRSGDPSYRRRRTAIRRTASYLIKEALAYPDEFIGWKAHALKAAREVLQQERISLLFSTSPPSTSHLVASQLHRETGIPWVADFRDLWTQNHYIRHTLPRTLIERRLEMKTLRDADLLVTVSSPLAHRLQQLHGKPTEVITNGYDEDDYSGDQPPLTPYFSLTYTGQIYAGKRDPSLVFAAVKELVEEKAVASGTFRIRFFGPEGDQVFVNTLAKQHGIQEYVVHEGRVDYQEAILRQRESTALLLLNWNVPEEKGVYTGKLFEYLGARRPILAIPRVNGVVGKLISEANAGIVAGTKQEIVRALEGWYDQFMGNQAVPYDGIETVIRQFTRRAQTEKLAELFDRLAVNRGS